jgi:hypothetical protein
MPEEQLFEPAESVIKAASKSPVPAQKLPLDGMTG